MGTLRDLQFALQLKIEELRQRDTLIDELELELDTKDELIRRLQDELDRHRAPVPLPGPSAASAACSAHFQDGAQRKTVISEPFSPEPVNLSTFSQRSCCDKSQATHRLIQAAFSKNTLLKNLEEGEMEAVIACMYPTTINQGCYVIQEGTTGAQAFILEEGRMEVTKDRERLQTMEPEDVFGELALLYNCVHAYSVLAQTDSRLWVLDSRSYQTVLMRSGLNSLSHTIERLRSVPFLQSLPEDVIMKMCDLTEETHYADGDCITRQGASGDTFYIISEGQVKVTEKKAGHEEHTVLSKLSETHWFGEKALWGEEVHTVSAVAAGEVTCLVIDRQSFRDAVDGSVFGSSDETQQSCESKVESDEDGGLLSSSTLSDFHILCTLAAEEFGHVDLVKLKRDAGCLYTMRVLKKKLILASGQREHVLREGRILMDTHCPFIVRLHKTFSEPECLYMLTEACLGGDLLSLLTDKGCLDECSTRFYTACVVEALTFLHSRGVIYRDVKPENVALDQHGYAKLVGTRCAKQLEVGKRTWTFCGSLGYMAPEILLTRGHGLSADFWSLGVFVFELLSGGMPFSGSDAVTIFNATIGGIDLIDFNKNISTSASGLIRELCRSRPSERLGSLRNGAKDVHKHKWFEGFDWEGLCKKTLKAPVIPKVKHPSDSSVCGDYTVDAAELHADWEDF